VADDIVTMGLVDKLVSLFGQPSAPIFIHSSFRTSSTWIWSKFRADPGVLAYYECFHEDLDSISAAGIEALRPNHWESGHPGMDPYFREFIPLLRRKGGVAGFDRSMAFDRFFPTDGYDGSLSVAETAYVERLIARCGENPVLPASARLAGCAPSNNRVAARTSSCNASCCRNGALIGSRSSSVIPIFWIPSYAPLRLINMSGLWRSLASSFAPDRAEAPTS
jgi:hypothetical protein